MESVKKDRTQCRRLFTKACNEFLETKAELSDIGKINKLKVIEEKALLMVACEEKYKQLLYAKVDSNETEIEQEVDESEVYIDRWRLFKQELENLTVKNNHELPSDEILQQNTLLRYPKIKLPIYDGDVRNWLNFWGQFEKIDKDSNLDLHDKFSYLMQAMEKGSPAEELIKSFPPGGISYEKAIKQLKARFGREDLLIQVYVRDLLSLVLQKQISPKYSLRKLYDRLESKLRSLELLGVTTDKYASMLFPLVESSLPEEILVAWERYRSTHRRVRGEDADQSRDIGEKSDLESILEFLQDEVEAEERIVLASQSFNHPKVRVDTKPSTKFHNERKTVGSNAKYNRVVEIPSATDLLTASQGQKQCIFCSNFHYSGDCIKVRKMPLKEREDLTQQSHCCFLCLKPGHRVKNCYMRAGCLNCGKRHHILLCRNMHHPVVPVRERESSSNERKQPEVNPEKDQALANVSKSPNVMLQTLTVIIRGNGKRRKARAIIDTASQRSYLLQNTAKEMFYESQGYEQLQHSLFGGNSTDIWKHDVFTLYLSSVDGTYNCNFKVLSQRVICESVPPVADEASLKELAECGVVPIDDCHGGIIEILIGADVAGKLMTGGHRLLPSGLAAIETKLGWTILGRMPQTFQSKNTSLVVTSMLSRVESITDLWTLDTLGITDPSVNKSQVELQKAAKEHFLSTVRVQDDRFVVHLPWLEDHAPLPDYYELALKRLSATVKRLKSENLYEAYEAVFKEWLKDGIIEEVKDDEEEVQALYLPHRAVVKENSTTRIRPVFDASAKIKCSPSLNDCLEKGENLIELIPNILTRFRKERIGVISDIQKAFLQIGVSCADRNYLRFLWITSDGELKVYRHCRVVFGVSCSPFLLGSTIQYHLQTVLDQIGSGECLYPKCVIEKLLNSFYVDNCVNSVKDEKELDLFIEVSTKVMAERKFILRGWEHTDFNAAAPVDSNVLGMIWDRKSDTLRVNSASLKELYFEKVTKRTILSAAHRLFDPIGVTCPFTLTPKLLLQKTWKLQLNWDEEVDSDTKREFLKWVTDSSCLNSMYFPRYFGAESNFDNCSVHFFCDASKQAYAVVAFIRIETINSVNIQLLQARSRVAPTGKKDTTIARLELLAATITSRLANTILHEIDYREVYFWTDSSTVLTWIKREGTWATFVQNRVLEIRALTPKENWRHVPGSMNPADLPSRGCSAQHLLNSKWWEGPEWLYLPQEKWPSSEFIVDENEVSKEKKKGITSLSSLTPCLMTKSENVETKWYYSYFSKYRKIVRMIAWILRFVNNARKINICQEDDLSFYEIELAERTLLLLVQKDAFSEQNVEKLKNLRTFVDKHGIIRVKTQVMYREDTQNFKYPVLLPSEHPVVHAMIYWKHQELLHAGVSLLMASLREGFWIIRARKTIRKVVQRCVRCKRFSARKTESIPIALPTERVQDAAVFQVVGVDLAGPLYLKAGHKSWIVLFTCAVYRAIHLELVTSLSTEAFLQSFRRFVARRGRPTVVYSDNGKNFVGANKAFSTIDWTQIAAKSAVQKIEWKFNPPTAAWWGGWWERLIQLVKRILRKVLGKAILSYEELVTVLCDCEMIVNSRPLTYVTEDVDDLSPLTPSVFLQENRSSDVVDIDAIESQGLNNRLKYVQQVREHLRKRFRIEYLGQLRQSNVNQKKIRPLSLNDVVIVESDQKRACWTLARVIKLISGKDGHPRVARIKTEGGELVRPVQKLYNLEVQRDLTPDPVIHTRSGIRGKVPEHF